VRRATSIASPHLHGSCTPRHFHCLAPPPSPRARCLICSASSSRIFTSPYPLESLFRSPRFLSSPLDLARTLPCRFLHSKRSRCVAGLTLKIWGPWWSFYLWCFQRAPFPWIRCSWLGLPVFFPLCLSLVSRSRAGPSPSGTFLMLPFPISFWLSLGSQSLGLLSSR
jgi:hypothetical protein